MFHLFILFALIPMIELALLIKVGSHIGLFNTVAIVILTAAIGAYMVKMEGIGVMYRIQQKMQEGVFPEDELINGMMILVAGALLLTPGFFTDVIGFLMVVPFTRNHIRIFAMKYIRNKMPPGDIEIKDFDVK